MDFDPANRRHKINAFRNRSRRRKEQVIRVDSAITAPYDSFTGANLQTGAALSSEIESYRRRVIALLNFFDSIAPHWWDQLHWFNGQLVKRPSKSAELAVKLQARLKARLERLTPRMVIPAAAAVVNIEEQETISVLPQSLLHAANRRSKANRLGNVQESLKMAYSIARRLGEVERSKQQLIVYAAEWINSDGRDFPLRAQRLALLAKNIKHCLVEKFKGVQALITHYYRRRSLSNPVEAENGIPAEIFTDPKSRLMYAFTEVTAASLSSTNEEILRMISNADLTLATDPAFANDFINNYAPNAFPLASFSLNSATIDGSQEEYTLVGITIGSNVDSSMGKTVHNGLIKTDKLEFSGVSSQHQTIPGLSSVNRRPFGLESRVNLEQPNIMRRNEVNGNLVESDNAGNELSEISSYKQRNSESEVRQNRKRAHIFTRLLSANESMSSLGSYDNIPINSWSSSTLENGSSHTLLFQLTSSFDDDQKVALTQKIATAVNGEASPKDTKQSEEPVTGKRGEEDSNLTTIKKDDAFNLTEASYNQFLGDLVAAYTYSQSDYK